MTVPLPDGYREGARSYGRSGICCRSTAGCRHPPCRGKTYAASPGLPARRRPSGTPAERGGHEPLYRRGAERAALAKAGSAYKKGPCRVDPAFLIGGPWLRAHRAAGGLPPRRTRRSPPRTSTPTAHAPAPRSVQSRPKASNRRGVSPTSRRRRDAGGWPASRQPAAASPSTATGPGWPQAPGPATTRTTRSHPEPADAGRPRILGPHRLAGAPPPPVGRPAEPVPHPCIE